MNRLTGFEPRTSGVESNSSTNRANSTVHHIIHLNNNILGSGCVAQLVERSAIRIQSLAKFIEHLFTVNCVLKRRK